MGKMMALPLSDSFTLYPIVGGGIAYGADSQRGLEVPGAMLNFTLYSKYQITDTIWFNYNPQYYIGVYGSDEFKDNFDGTKGLYHEFAISYQIDSSKNMRLWYNAEHDSFDDGEVRLEFNKQF